MISMGQSVEKLQKHSPEKDKLTGKKNFYFLQFWKRQKSIDDYCLQASNMRKVSLNDYLDKCSSTWVFKSSIKVAGKLLHLKNKFDTNCYLIKFSFLEFHIFLPRDQLYLTYLVYWNPLLGNVLLIQHNLFRVKTVILF